MNALEKMVENKRLPVLFIGSGIPKRYLKKFPSWDELLNESFKKVNNDPFYIGRYKEKFKREGISIFDQYKELGTIIENDFNEAFYNREISFGKSKNPAWAKRGISPYKMYIRHRLKNLRLNNSSVIIKKELQEIALLKNKVSAVITTNYDNFIFITYKENEKDLIEIKRTIITEKGENIPITEIATDNFLKVYKTINQLIPGMTPKNIRDTQRLVKRIVNNTIVSGDPSNVIFGIDEIPDDLSDKNIAIAIGNKEDIINQYGYSVVKDEEILEDIIFNNKKFNSKNMCKERFKSLPLNRLMPVYKYIKRAKIDINEVPKLKNYVNYHDEIDKIITPTYKKKNLKNAPKFNNITEVKKYMQETNDINKVFKGVLNSIDYLSLYQLREICKLYFYNYIDKLIKNSNFKRVVMYIDYKENYK